MIRRFTYLIIMTFQRPRQLFNLPFYLFIYLSFFIYGACFGGYPVLVCVCVCVCVIGIVVLCAPDYAEGFEKEKEKEMGSILFAFVLFLSSFLCGHSGRRDE